MSDIEVLLQENRKFPPAEAFTREALVRSRALYDEAAADHEQFWARRAAELEWMRPWDRVLEWDPPFAKWFVGGKVNISYNCLDRHLLTHRKNKLAFIWEGEPGEQRTFTYAELHREVCRFANVLKKLGIETGDRIFGYRRQGLGPAKRRMIKRAHGATQSPPLTSSAAPVTSLA